MNSRLVLTLAITSVLLTACSGGSNTPVPGTQTPPTNGNTGVITARFDPTNAIIPFPNNLLRLGSVDGTLNIPVANASNFGDPAVAMNALDGFSTTAPWATTFSERVNPSTVTPGNSVRVFEVTTTAQGAVTGVVRALTPGVDFTAVLSATDTGGKTLGIVPLSRLKPLTGYMAVLTNGLQDTLGNKVTPDTTYFLAQRSTPICNGTTSLDPLVPSSSCPTIETLRQLTNAQEAAAAAAGVDKSSIVLSWVATTQSTTQVLGQMRANPTYVAPRSISAVNATLFCGIAPNLVNPALANNFNIYLGKLALPYLLLDNTQTANWPTGTVRPGPLGGFWTGPAASNVTVFNPNPVIQSTQTIPMLLNVPLTPKPANGYPVVIYGHGITRTRTDAFAVTNALAAAGFAVIAIDTPLHGIVANSTLGGAGACATGIGQAATERTFSLDFVNNTTGAAGPDGVADGSGTHMINLASLLTSRDNLRQGILDLMNLRASIPNLDITGDGAGDFDDAKVYYAGQSMGGIIGSSFVALEPKLSVALLNVPGGGLARLLEGSQSFGPIIRAGLAASGVTKPSAAFDQFMVATQTVVDSGDPINLGPAAGATDAILVHMVTGDTVVPNSVAEGPLSGTRPLIRAYPLDKITGSTAAAPIRHHTIFNAGSHGSLLDPTASPAVTVEMQTEMVSFFLSGGTQVQVGNPTVIETTP